MHLLDAQPPRRNTIPTPPIQRPRTTLLLRSIDMPQTNPQHLAAAPERAVAVGHVARQPAGQTLRDEHLAHPRGGVGGPHGDVVLPARAHLGAAVAVVPAPAADLPEHEALARLDGEELGQDDLAVSYRGTCLLKSCVFVSVTFFIFGSCEVPACDLPRRIGIASHLLWRGHAGRFWLQCRTRRGRLPAWTGPMAWSWYRQLC